MHASKFVIVFFLAAVVTGFCVTYVVLRYTSIKSWYQLRSLRFRRPGVNTKTSAASTSAGISVPFCQNCKQDRKLHVAGLANVRFRKPNCSGKLLVYQCLKGDICGGLADRQKGIMSAFLLALLTNRTLIVNHRKSCDIKQIMEPRMYGWLKCLPSLSRYKHQTKSDVNYIDGKGNLPRNFSVLPPGDIWSSQMVTVHLNTRLNSAIKGHQDATKQLPWLFNTQEHVVVTGLMNILFKPVRRLETEVDVFIKKHVTNSNKIQVGVHIRSYLLKDSNDPSVFFKFLQQFTNASRYVIYVAADDADVRRRAAKSFPNSLTLQSKIVHIDMIGYDCQGMYTAAFEQQVLARSDILVLSPSGFSRNAAYIRGGSENIYLFMKKEGQINAHFKQVTLEDLVRLYPDS